MEWQVLLDSYKHSKLSVRLFVLFLLGVSYPVWTWYEENQILGGSLEVAISEEEAARHKYISYKENISELPVLEKRLADVERGLEKAKRYLPNAIEQNEILREVAQYEKEAKVVLLNYEHGAEYRPDPSLEYLEFPIAIEVRSTFSNIMMFFDKLVHMKNLTHLREIQFTRVDREQDEQPRSSNTQEKNADRQLVEAKAKFVLFKSIK